MEVTETCNQIGDTSKSHGKKFYGKYRGVVVNNIDPMGKGRITANVPDVAGFVPSTWAMPCVPVAGLNMGMVAVPPFGAGVWIEFEHGDLDKPIWTGCFWGSNAEVPNLSKTTPPGVPGITLQTPTQNGIRINDVPGPAGGISLKVKTTEISINETGITISNGPGLAEIKLIGKSITLNGQALVIT